MLNILSTTFKVELESWDSWGADEQNMSNNVPNNQHRNYPGYQNSHFGAKPEVEPEPDINYFDDMTPQVRTQRVSILLLIVLRHFTFVISTVLFCISITVLTLEVVSKIYDL